MWLGDSTVWHRLALGGTSSKLVGPGQEPRGAKVRGFWPQRRMHTVEEAGGWGRAPVPTKCCLSASGRGAGAGADSKGDVNSNEKEDKTPETLITHRPQTQGRAAPQQPGDFLMFLVLGLAPRLHVASGQRLLPSPGRTRGKETGHLEDEPLLGEGALETSGDGRAGMSREGGVSRQSQDGGQCWGVLLPTGLAGLPVLPRSPCTGAGALAPHWVRSW